MKKRKTYKCRVKFDDTVYNVILFISIICTLAALIIAILDKAGYICSEYIVIE